MRVWGVWGVCEHLSGLSAWAAWDVDGRQALRELHRGQSSSAEQDDAVLTLRAEGERDLWAHIKRHRLQLHVPGPGEAHGVQVLTERESQCLVCSFSQNPPVVHQLMASDGCLFNYGNCPGNVILFLHFFVFSTFQMALCSTFLRLNVAPGQNCIVERNKQTN